MSFAVIVVAAGRSTRFSGSVTKKPFVRLGGVPVWRRSASAFLPHEDVSEIVVVVSRDELEWFQTNEEQGLEKLASELRDDQTITVVAGGESRAASVGNGLKAVRYAEFVAVHDAARPLVSSAEVDGVLKAAREHGAAILATRVTSTVKRSRHMMIESTVDREHLWLAQTPQVSRRDWLEEAYADTSSETWSPLPTDEAELLERFGRTVHLVQSSATNFKITTQDDFILAEALVAGRSRASVAMRTTQSDFQ